MAGPLNPAWVTSKGPSAFKPSPGTATLTRSTLTPDNPRSHGTSKRNVKRDGTGGTSARLLGEWGGAAGPEIVFIGDLPAGTPAERLVSSGRAQCMSWNAHPRLSDNVALARAVGAGFVVPAFGDAAHADVWRSAFATARVVTQTSLRLS